MNIEKLKNEIEKKIDALVEQGIQSSATIDAVDKLVDIKKDLMEIEKMDGQRYGNYRGGDGNEYRNYNGNYNGNYNNYSENYNARQRDSQGRYMERGVDARYKGHEKLDRMYMAYGNYEQGKEEYNRGNYGAKDMSMHELKTMLESCVDFVEMLKRDANSQEAVEMIKKYTKQMSEV